MSSVKAILTATLLSASMVTPALAQVASTVDNVAGDVVVQRAGEFYTTESSGLLADGDCVTSLETASATVTLANGCAMELSSDQSVIINTSAKSCDDAFTPAEGICNIEGFESQDIQLGIIPLLIGAGIITTTIIVATDDDEPTSP